MRSLAILLAIATPVNAKIVTKWMGINQWCVQFIDPRCGERDCLALTVCPSTTTTPAQQTKELERIREHLREKR